MKTTIVYFSASGNTERMAEMLATELRRQGSRVLITSLDEARGSDLSQADLVLLGSPAWSGEGVVPVLKEFVRSTIDRLKAARVALFGSYDWGEGQYLDDFVHWLRAEGLTVHDVPLLRRVADGNLEAETAAVFVAGIINDLHSAASA